MTRSLTLSMLASAALALGSCAEKNTALLTEDEALSTPTLTTNLQPRTVQLRPVYRQLQLNGQVTVDADQTAPVYPLVSGVVEEVPVHLGDQVAKGQVLALIRSTEATELQSQRAIAATELTSARQQLATTTSLFKDGLAAERDVALARAAWRKATSEVQKLDKQLSVYSLSPGGLLALRAPIAGTITEKAVTPRTQLNTSNQQRLFTISSLRDVWVLADVFQSDVQTIQVGDTATVTTLTYPGRHFTGRVDKLFNLLDPQTKTMKVRVRLSNTDYQLKPGMYARVQVRGREAGEQLPVVPKGSVVFANGRRFVVVINQKQELNTREVQLHSTTGDLSYVAAGLHPGERVATHNALLLYDELSD